MDHAIPHTRAEIKKLMDISLSPKDRAFQDDVRRFLDQAFTPELRELAARQTGVFADGELNRRWHKILFDKGWIAPAWPKERGGPGWTSVQRYIFDNACAEAGTPVLPAMGLQMCGPVLMGYGTAAQKEYFLPRILSGEHYWCQGYSEPQSGSDLASLQTRAVRDGDDYVVNGTKIWTTHAQFANWMFLLVRTSTEGKPQTGISFLLLDMKTPGLSVKPIVSISGDHEVNQCFFDDVRIPVSNRVGEENQGWTVAKYLLEFERGGGSYAARIRGMLRKIRALAASQNNGHGCSLAEDGSFLRTVTEAEIATEALDYTERRVIAQLSAGNPAGDATASMLKLKGSETLQRVTEIALETLGFYAAADQRHMREPGSNAEPVGPAEGTTVTGTYLNTRAASIFGGSNEVQRNILARTMLGL
jgi:alkylation response protein AidB-like acyl-CoA dehydrogenase